MFASLLTFILYTLIFWYSKAGYIIMIDSSCGTLARSTFHLAKHSSKHSSHILSFAKGGFSFYVTASFELLTPPLPIPNAIQHYHCITSYLQRGLFMSSFIQETLHKSTSSDIPTFKEIPGGRVLYHIDNI